MGQHGLINPDFVRVAGKSADNTFMPTGPVIVAEGRVRMGSEGNYLAADRVTWTRRTGDTQPLINRWGQALMIGIAGALIGYLIQDQASSMIPAAPLAAAMPWVSPLTVSA